MTARSRGRGLFIVDNSVSGWTGLRYLKEWAGIAKAFDIATGYFEIGALLALDGKWQGLDKIRILMGAETTHYFARTVGVNHLKAHINQMERALRDRVGMDGAVAAEHLDDAQDILVSDDIFRQLVVQRSRA